MRFRKHSNSCSDF